MSCLCGSTGTAGLPARQVLNHLWERACSQWHRRGSTEVPHRLHRGQARSHKSSSQRQLNAGLSTLPAVTVEMIAQLACGAPVQPAYRLDRFQTTCGSGLARDGIDAVQLKYRSACIAGKPASTKAAPERQLNAGLSTLPAVTAEIIAQLASGARYSRLTG